MPAMIFAAVVLLRIAAGLTGLIIAFGALFFLGSTGNPLSTLAELLAGAGGIVVAIIPARVAKTGFMRGIFAVISALCVFNAAIGVQGVLAGRFQSDILLWAIPNAIAVLGISVAAWMNSRRAPQSL